MYQNNPVIQNQLEFISIEDLVPKNHLLRLIDNYIDFSFIAEKTKDYYCPDNGRPCLDPVVMFKMLLLGYLYGIRSERRLVEEIQVNVAYRWFLGFSLSDPVPHHSTLSQNRIRRFTGTTIYQEIFDEIVFQAIKHRLVGGRHLFSDSTKIKASANKTKFKRELVKESTREYLSELDKDVNEDRANRGKKPLPPRDNNNNPSGGRMTRVSTTDPDSGYIFQDRKQEGFYYSNHQTVDGKHNIITDAYVTKGSVHDSVPYLERLDHQIKRFGFNALEGVALDAGYLTAPICKGLYNRNIYAAIAHRRFKSTEGLISKRKFTFYEEEDCYVCPEGHQLQYKTTNRNGYREYVSNSDICSKCPRLKECTRSKNCQKVITRHLWEDAREWAREIRLSKPGKAIYKLRKETIERSFADAKELHGLRYCRMRGNAKVSEQVLLTAACQNMKIIARNLWAREMRLAA